MGLFAALSVASTGLQLFGQLRQRDADKAIAKTNIREARRRADLFQSIAREAVEFDREKQIAQEGQTVAEFAARGIDTSSSSVFDRVSAQIRVDEFNNSSRLFEADMQARDLRFGAELQKFQSKQRSQQQALSIFGNILSNPLLTRGAK